MSKLAFAKAAQKVITATETEQQRKLREEAAQRATQQRTYNNMIAENDRCDEKQAAVFHNTLHPVFSLLKNFAYEEKLNAGEIPASSEKMNPYSKPSREIFLRHKSIPAGSRHDGTMQIKIEDRGQLSYVYHGAGLPVKVTPAEVLEKIALFVEKYDPAQLKQLAAKAPKPRR